MHRVEHYRYHTTYHQCNWNSCSGQWLSEWLFVPPSTSCLFYCSHNCNSILVRKLMVHTSTTLNIRRLYIHSNFIGFSKSKQRQLQLGTSFEQLRVKIGLGKTVYLQGEQWNDSDKGDLSYNSISSVWWFFILKTLGLTSSIFIVIDSATSVSYEE